MATAVSCASRFAVLKIEDDEDDVPVERKQKAMPSKTNDCQSLNKKKPKKKKTSDEKDNPPPPPAAECLAFSSANKAKKKQETSHKGKKQVSQDQWEEWIKKDNEFVTDAYEQDLQQAILLSKLDYEEKKQFYDTVKETDQSKGSKNNKKSNKKKDKPTTLSLDQFNSLHSTDTESRTKDSKIESPKSKSEPCITDQHFFEDVAADAEKILHKEHQTESLKKLEPFIGQQVRTLHFQDEIEKRDKEIERLTSEVDALKNELLTVKTRNKKLCNILAQGEMREKAEILIQVEHLNRIKDELTEQVTELHAALEQERSKVHTLTMDVKKYQSGRKESK